MGARTRDHARPGRPGLGVHDDVLLHQARFQQGGAGEDDRRGVASGVGNQVRAADLVAEELGQTVDRPLQVVDIGVGVSVPLLVDGDVVHPVVARQVDGLDPLVEERGHLVHGHTMGRRDEDEVEVLRVGDPLGEVYVDVSAEERVDVGHPDAGVLTGGHGCDLDVRMRAQDARQLAAGVSRAPYDAYSGHFHHTV